MAVERMDAWDMGITMMSHRYVYTDHIVFVRCPKYPDVSFCFVSCHVDVFQLF